MPAISLRSFYVYEAQTLAIATGGNATDQIQVESDADFWWIKSCYMADIAGAAVLESTTVVPNVDVQIVDTGSGRQLLNGNIPISSLFGNGQLPFVLPLPQVFKANSVVRIDFTSREAAITPNIRLAFIGYKDFGKVVSAGQA